MKVNLLLYIQKNFSLIRKIFQKLLNLTPTKQAEKKMIDGKNTSLKERVYVVSKSQSKVKEKYSSCITA